MNFEFYKQGDLLFNARQLKWTTLSTSVNNGENIIALYLHICTLQVDPPVRNGFIDKWPTLPFYSRTQIYLT